MHAIRHIPSLGAISRITRILVVHRRSSSRARGRTQVRLMVIRSNVAMVSHIRLRVRVHKHMRARIGTRNRIGRVTRNIIRNRCSRIIMGIRFARTIICVFVNVFTTVSAALFVCVSTLVAIYTM